MVCGLLYVICRVDKHSAIHQYGAPINNRQYAVSGGWRFTYPPYALQSIGQVFDIGYRVMQIYCRIIGMIVTGLLCGQLFASDVGEQPIAEPLGERTPQDIQNSQQLAKTCHTDEGQAPTMVVIRPGQFQMGSMDGAASEQPPRFVTIPQPFAISRCEITVGQFRQFVQDKDYHQGKVFLTTAEQSGKGCYVWDAENRQAEQLVEHNWKDPGFKQDDDHPVVCVSWDDTQAYMKWLSRRTGAQYRLPTEAEWEYAARADTVMARFYQDDQQCDYANGLDQDAKSIADPSWTLAECSDGYVYTAPVASFGHNHFGLFDMLGNVWEWTQDCWHENYDNAPHDGSAWLQKNDGACDRRVVRGGSWNNKPQNLRSANRNRNNTDNTNNNIGFRIASTPALCQNRMTQGSFGRASGCPYAVFPGCASMAAKECAVFGKRQPRSNVALPLFIEVIIGITSGYGG